MKVIYFNDRSTQALVKYVFAGSPAYEYIEPGTFKVIEIDVGENEAPFIKVWDNNTVLIAAADITVVETPFLPVIGEVS